MKGNKISGTESEHCITITIHKFTGNRWLGVLAFHKETYRQLIYCESSLQKLCKTKRSVFLCAHYIFIEWSASGVFCGHGDCTTPVCKQWSLMDSRVMSAEMSHGVTLAGSSKRYDTIRFAENIYREIVGRGGSSCDRHTQMIWHMFLKRQSNLNV